MLEGCLDSEVHGLEGCGLEGIWTWDVCGLWGYGVGEGVDSGVCGLKVCVDSLVEGGQSVVTKSPHY